MIEKIVTSKTRVKILKFYLTHIDDRYYLRELERMLDESLSPLRRQLLKLEKMGILIAEYEANLKYYRLNKNFTGIEDLRRLMLGPGVIARSEATKQSQKEIASLTSFARNDKKGQPRNDMVTIQPRSKRMRYDIAILTAVSVFVLIAAIFIAYTSSKNIRQVASLISDKTTQVAEITTNKITNPTRPDEMISRRWKVRAGSFPVFSTGETGEKTSKEL